MIPVKQTSLFLLIPMTFLIFACSLAPLPQVSSEEALQHLADVPGLADASTASIQFTQSREDVTAELRTVYLTSDRLALGLTVHSDRGQRYNLSEIRLVAVPSLPVKPTVILSLLGASSGLGISTAKGEGA